MHTTKGNTGSSLASLSDALLARHGEERLRDKPKERLQGRLVLRLHSQGLSSSRPREQERGDPGNNVACSP